MRARSFVGLYPPQDDVGGVMLSYSVVESPTSRKGREKWSTP